MIEKFKQMLKEKNYSQHTIDAYLCAIRNFNAENFDLEFVSQKLTDVNLKSNSQSSYKRFLTAWLKFNEMYDEAEELKSIKLKKRDNIYREVVGKDDVYQLTEIQESEEAKSVKMKIILRLLFETGIRIAELYKLNFKNDKLYVVGKGNKLRQLFYVEQTLDQYLHFYPELKIDTSQYKIRKWTKSIIGKEFTPHSMRRSFATYMLQNGANIKTVQAQMGHSDVQTTFKYLHNSEEYNKKEYRKFFK